MGYDSQRFATRCHSRTRGHFLIVEDDPVCRQFCATIISTLGFQPLLAFNPKTALTQFRSTNVKGLLLDWNIPYPGSLALLAKFFENKDAINPRIPVIIMSADEQLSIEQIEAAGATQMVDISMILKKPFTSAELESAVHPGKAPLHGTEPAQKQHTQITSLFLRSLREDMFLLDEKISSNEQHEVLQLLHRIQGAASIMGLVPFEQLCSTLTSSLQQSNNSYQWTESYLQLMQAANELLEQHTTAEEPEKYASTRGDNPTRN